jgi:hypothetical protein
MELPSPDLDLIKQGEQVARNRRGRFAERRSGNTAGGSADCAARLVLAGEWSTPQFLLLAYAGMTITTAIAP